MPLTDHDMAVRSVGREINSGLNAVAVALADVAKAIRLASTATAEQTEAFEEIAQALRNLATRPGSPTVKP